MPDQLALAGKEEIGGGQSLSLKGTGYPGDRTDQQNCNCNSQNIGHLYHLPQSSGDISEEGLEKMLELEDAAECCVTVLCSQHG